MGHQSDTMAGRRRLILRGIAASALAGTFASWSRATWAEGHINLPFEGGQRDLTNSFPQKGEMILLRTRPPLLETPFSVFDHGVFTPNDQFYVRWHLANIPAQIDGAAFRLNVHGAVKRELSLSLTELLTTFPRVELAAVNQCSGTPGGSSLHVSREVSGRTARWATRCGLVCACATFWTGRV